MDQYENDQYIEERIPGQKLDEVWLECAKKPMSASTKAALEFVYPPEVIDRYMRFPLQRNLKRKKKRKLIKKTFFFYLLKIFRIVVPRKDLHNRKR